MMADTSSKSADDPGDGQANVYYSSGEALTAEEAFALTRKILTRVIVVAGPAESGKTTLVASLYERFHEGPLSSHLFAGSQTLVGFETRCHLSRRASGRTSPDTERTKRAAKDVLLHLTVRPKEGGARLNLLITDIYGEAFTQAADSTDEAEQLTVLKRADFVAILIDGEKLSSLVSRQDPFSQADSLLASALEVGVLGRESRVQAIITKADRLRVGDRVLASSEFAATKWKWLKSRHEASLYSFEMLEVAARPEPPSTLTPGYGLDELFTRWVSPSQSTARVTDIVHSNGFGPFDLFGRAWVKKKD